MQSAVCKCHTPVFYALKNHSRTRVSGNRCNYPKTYESVKPGEEKKVLMKKKKVTEYRGLSSSKFG